MDKKELLLKPVWDYKDIMKYFNVKSPTTAIKIKTRAVNEQDGGVIWGSDLVKTDSVLALYGTSRTKELEIIKAYEEYGEDMMINYGEEELH